MGRSGGGGWVMCGGGGPAVPRSMLLPALFVLAVSILLPNPESVALTLAVMVSVPRSVVFTAKDQLAHGVEPEPVGVAP